MHVDNWCFENIISDVKSYDEIFECIIDEWRSFATLSLDEKRDARFNFLCKLQRIFTEYDSDITKQIIIALAYQCHGADYSYAIPNNITSVNDKIDIRCNWHGTFSLSVIDHLIPPKGVLAPRGCPQCLAESRTRSGRKFNTNVFIAKAEMVHGDMYDYRYAKYYNTLDKITVGCLACRALDKPWFFEPRAKHHLLGSRCYKCVPLNRLTFDQAVERSKAIHGDNYEYLEILPPNLQNKGQRISYRCKECGNIHTQLINTHTSGKCGCPICGRKNTGKQNETPYDELINQAKTIHGDKYEYLGSSYIEDDHKKRRCLTYLCNRCGAETTQRVEAHLKGHGCNNCNYGGVNLTTVKRPLSFYLIRILLPEREYDTSVVYKVGYTGRAVDIRISGELPLNTDYEIIVNHVFNPGGDAYILEQKILDQFRKPYQYRGNFKFKKGGNGELFVKEGYNDILNMIEQFIADNH